jgi:dihydroorotate dehydrogenase (fumarate)
VEYLGVMLGQVRAWMERHDFSSANQFRGRMSSKASDNPASYERVQFMKATSGIE